MAMKGAKRYGVAESSPASNDSPFWNKKVAIGSAFEVHRTENSQQQSMAFPSLDVQRAELSRQHVRALNAQFASWVQTQLKNHPDELWEDGIRDYLSHVSSIMEKFSDVVNWLKANAAKGEILPITEKLAPEVKNTNNDAKSFLGQTGLAAVSTSTTTSFPMTPWSSGVFSNNQNSKGSVPNSQSSGIFSNSQSSVMFSSSPSFGLFSAGSSSGLTANSQSSVLFSTGSSSGLTSNSQSSTLFSTGSSSGLTSNSQSSGLFSNNQSSGFSFSNQSSGFFSNTPNSQSSGLVSNSKNPPRLLFSNNQTPFGNQSTVLTTNHDASDDVDNENEEQPSSPSLKKTEEKGITVVHEVKCKLYVKSNDPADKDPWKDKGTGHLSIKCKEGVSTGTKESKPTIIVRNDVGRILLNALLYPGIKTNTQKNSIVAIFHTAGDGDGNEIVTRTFLIRLKTEDDRIKLAAAIKDYAPSS